MPGRSLPAEKRAEILRLFNDGANGTEIARQLRVSVAMPYKILRQAGLNPIRYGTVARSLSDADRHEARRLYQTERLGTPAIAERLRVSSCTILRILKSSGVDLRNQSECQRVYPLNESAFDDATSPDVQFFAGLLMADGCVYHRRGSWSIHLQLQRRDLELVQRFRSFLGTTQPIAHRPPPERPTKLHGRTVCGYGSVSLGVRSKKLADALARYGVLPRKTATAQAQLIEDSPHFWRGCMDGDGSFYVSERHERPGCYRLHAQLIGAAPLIEQFADFINRNVPGKRPGVYRDKRCPTVRYVIISGSRAFGLIRLLYGSGGVSLKRKQAIADAILGRSELGHNRSEGNKAQWARRKGVL